MYVDVGSYSKHIHYHSTNGHFTEVNHHVIPPNVNLPQTIPKYSDQRGTQISTTSWKINRRTLYNHDAATSACVAVVAKQEVVDNGGGVPWTSPYECRRWQKLASYHATSTVPPHNMYSNTSGMPGGNGWGAMLSYCTHHAKNNQQPKNTHNGRSM